MTPNRRGGRLPALLLLAGAAGCAAAGGAAPTRAELLSDRPVPPDRRIECTVMRQPETLPAPEALVEVDALSADAAALWQGTGRPAGYVLLAVRHDAEGVNVRRDVIESTVPEAVADSLQELVFAHRRATPPAEREWGVRLRVDLGERPSLRVGRSELCPPYREEDRWIAGPTRDAPFFSPAARDPFEVDDMVRVRVLVDERGRVTDAQIERGMLRADAGLLHSVRTMLFFPAEQDGHPVAGETVIRIFRPLPGRRTVR